MAKDNENREKPMGSYNLRSVVEEVFQGDVISKMSYGSALKALAYKTVKLTYDEIIPPLDEDEAFFVTERFMGGWLEPLLENINRQPAENKDKEKIKANSDFDAEDGIPDKIGDFDILDVAKAIGQSHISEIVAGKPESKEEQDMLQEIKDKFMANGKSMTSTLKEVVDSPDYTNFIKHAISSAALYLGADEPRQIGAKTDDLTDSELAEEDSRPFIDIDPDGEFSDKFKDMYKSEWFSILKVDKCVICKKNPATYSPYDENYNNAARDMGYDPRKLCEDCKSRLFEGQMGAWHGQYDRDD